MDQLFQSGVVRLSETAAQEISVTGRPFLSNWVWYYGNSQYALPGALGYLHFSVGPAEFTIP